LKASGSGDIVSLPRSNSPLPGVNLNTHNLASLHTTPNCTMPETRLQTGTTTSTNCDTSVDSNSGCGTSFDQTCSYGAGFNDVHGGYYAMQKSASQGINVWFWSRDDLTVPQDVRYYLDTIFPESWGLPNAAFPLGSCDYNSHFNAHQIIFDLTLCGDWAGNVFASSGCGNSTCSDFVDNNPAAFSEAYWEINSLHVYTPYGWS